MLLPSKPPESLDPRGKRDRHPKASRLDPATLIATFGRLANLGSRWTKLSGNRKSDPKKIVGSQKIVSTVSFGGLQCINHQNHVFLGARKVPPSKSSTKWCTFARRHVGLFPFHVSDHPSNLAKGHPENPGASWCTSGSADLSQIHLNPSGSKSFSFASPLASTASPGGSSRKIGFHQRISPQQMGCDRQRLGAGAKIFIGILTI